MEFQLIGRPTFAVLGVGAVGGLYGGLLAKAGFDVHFLARTDFDHLSKDGLRVESPWGDFHLGKELSVFSEVQQIPQVDCVIVAWKSTANQFLSSILTHFAKSSPTVLVLQNGLDVERDSALIVGSDAVVGGCCFLCCNRIGPGHIRHLDYGRIAMASYGVGTNLKPQSTSVQSPAEVRLNSIAKAFQQAGIPVEVTNNLAEVRWKKLAWNIPFNGLSVVLNSDTRSIIEHSHSAKLAEELMHEVIQSAAACGVVIDQSHTEKMLNDTRLMVPYASSMLLDYQAKRPMEIEAIFGNPIRAAMAAGFHPHRIEMLYQQLKFLESTHCQL